MSAAETERDVRLDDDDTIAVHAGYAVDEVWLCWRKDGARFSSFITPAQARELAAALVAVADATDEAVKAAEHGVAL